MTSFIDDALTGIGQYAFYYCTSLTSVDIPSVTSIGSSAFRGCTSLTSVDIPEVTSVGANAFDGCSNLTTLILRNSTRVTSLSSQNAFTNCPAIIYVPDELVDSYKTASNWSAYADRIKGLSELPEGE